MKKKKHSRKDEEFKNAKTPRISSDGYLGIPRSFPLNSHIESTTENTETILGSNYVTPNGASRSRLVGPPVSKQENGLTILPWEEFIFNPRSIKDLFHLERNGIITYDPEEVNVFFHATRMNKPTFGDIAENGKSWILSVQTAEELEQVRIWLTERVSVFGATLVKKDKFCSKSQRAPCLVIIDPHVGTIKDKLQLLFAKCFSSLERKRKFCFEINLNGCVENWCERITGCSCKAVGATLIITNGDDKDSLLSGENIFCCVACFPVWAIQTAIVRIHRSMAYDDISIELGLEELTLHGSQGCLEEDKGRLFDVERPGVFRTKPSEQGIAVLDPRRGTDFEGHKYICVKKYNRNSSAPIEESMSEHETISLQHLLAHLKSSETKKPKKSSLKKKGGNPIDASSGYDTGDSRPTTKESNSSDNTHLINADVLVHASADFSEGAKKMGGKDLKAQRQLSNESKKIKKEKKDEYGEFSDESESDESGASEHENRMETFLVASEKEKLKESKQRGSSAKKRQKKQSESMTNGNENSAYDSDDANEHSGTREIVSHHQTSNSKGLSGLDLPQKSDSFPNSDKIEDNMNSSMKYKKMQSEESDTDSSGKYNQQNEQNNDPPNEPHYPEVLQKCASENNSEQTSVQQLCLLPDEDEFVGRARSVIPKDKSDKSCLIETDDEVDGSEKEYTRPNEEDLELTDCELDNDYDDDQDDEQTEAKTNDMAEESQNDNYKKNSKKEKRPRTGRYDSTRKYLGVHVPKRNFRPDSAQGQKN